ncbi:MAG: hypothetical protein HYX78_02110 [Armatimonadetes bacterium]|nr:hypothetical protein [Armatimonadota bacterium]
MQEIASTDAPVHKGLIYRIDLRAESAVKSINSAVSYASQVTDQLSAVYGTAIDYPVPQFSIDVDRAYQNRELAQVLHNVPILHEPRREYNHQAYLSFYSRLDRLRLNDGKSAMRIDRALHYLRNSYLEQDPIDRFEDSWVALEAINPLTRRKYSRPTTYKRKCKNCDRDLFCRACNAQVCEGDNASGIDYIITQLLGQTQDAAKRLRTKRIDIVHARTGFAAVLNCIGELTQLAQRAVIAGTLDFLGFSKGEVSSLLQTMLPIATTPRVIVSATLENLSVEALKTYQKYPQLYLRCCECVTANRLQAHSREALPLAVQLLIGIQHFQGNWEILEMNLPVQVDSAIAGPAPEVIARKWNSSR